MAATSTPSISSLVARLCAQYPDLRLEVSDDLSWNPTKQTVYYAADSTASDLLHEVGHALLGHKDFKRDIRLLEMERDAWTKARDIAASLDLSIDEEIATAHLDTYRDWLHARSTCPKCGETGLETDTHIYSCLSCGARWRVNDARRHALRRYIVSK